MGFHGRFSSPLMEKFNNILLDLAAMMDLAACIQLRYHLEHIDGCESSIEMHFHMETREWIT
jgi:hypothetical protein